MDPSLFVGFVDVLMLLNFFHYEQHNEKNSVCCDSFFFICGILHLHQSVKPSENL